MPWTIWAFAYTSAIDVDPEDRRNKQLANPHNSVKKSEVPSEFSAITVPDPNVDKNRQAVTDLLQKRPRSLIGTRMRYAVRRLIAWVVSNPS